MKEVKNTFKAKVLPYFLKTILPVAVITASVLLCICPLSCRATEEGLVFLEGDYEVPHIKGFSVEDENTLQLDFTESVKLPELLVYSGESTDEEQKDFLEVKPQWKEGNCSVMLLLSKAMEAGKSYVLQGIAEDRNGNTLTFSLPFTGFNSCIPVLVISEIQISQGWKKVNGIDRRFTEWVELKALTEGNLAGLRLYSACYGEKTQYVFPSVKVNKGQYITVHLRTITEDKIKEGDSVNAVSETGEDLNLSVSWDSCASAMDLWSENTAACINKNDIILLENTFDGRILDAVMLTEYGEAEKENYSEITEKVLSSGVWTGAPFASHYAVNTSGNRSISRRHIPDFPKEEITASAAAYMITADTGSSKNKITGVTPGYENSSNEYVIKESK